MKNSFKIAICLPLLFLFSCKNEPTPAGQNTATSTPTVGKDVDEHGCRTSAGMVWSEVRKECIALFQGGVRMVPVDSFLDKTLAAFVVQKSDIDDSQVELFIPNKKETTILDKQADGSWKNADYQVSKAGKDYEIKDGKDNHLLYKGTEGK